MNSLSGDEIRVEALRQALYCGGNVESDADKIVKVAEKFEEFLSGKKGDGDGK